jgi:hypothetical protein
VKDYAQKLTKRAFGFELTKNPSTGAFNPELKLEHQTSIGSSSLFNEFSNGNNTFASDAT